MDPREELMALRRMAELEAKAAGQSSANFTAPDAIPGQRSISQAVPEPSMQDRIMGAIETPIALGAGAVGGVVAPIAGVVGSLFSGKYGTPEGVKAGEEIAKQVQGQFYQPRTQTAQQALTAIGKVAEPLIGVPLPTLNALGQAAPAATRAIRDVARSEANLVGGAIAAPLEARAARIQEQNVAQSYARAPIIDATQAAQRQGFAVNPAITNPTAANKAKSMMVGPAFDDAAAKFNPEQAVQVVRKDLGVAPTEKLTTQSIDKALDAAGKPYDVIRKMDVLTTPVETLQELQALKKPALIGGEQAATAIGSLIDDAVSKLQEGRSGALILDDIRSMRRNANAVYKAQSVNPDPLALAKADAQMAIANTLEKVIDANAPNAKALSDMRAARVRMAQIYDHERAINFANERVDPQVYAKLLEERKGAMTGVGADIGKVAAMFPQIMSLQPLTATQMPRVARSGLASAGGALLGGAIGGYPGAIAGASAAGAAGWTGTQLAARKMTTPGYQASRAVPTDYRPQPNMMRPVEPNVPTNALVPYDFSQQVITADQIPNWTFGRAEPQVSVSPIPAGPARIAAPSAQSTLGGIAAERARSAAMSRTLGQQAEAQQAAAEAAAPRKVATGGVQFDLDPITGKLVPTSQGIKGATPETFSNFGSALETASSKVTQGKLFDMTAAEKVAWNKTKIDLAEVAPGFKALDDKAIASKMMDRAWVEQTAAKVREKAAAFEQIAARAANERARQSAMANRERMLDLAEQMDETLRTPRPTSTGGQGPKTRAFQRNKLNMLSDQDVVNQLLQRP